MGKQINIELGMLSDPIEKQLSENRFSFDQDTISQFQKDAEAISRLCYRDLIPASLCDDLRNKLRNEIMGNINNPNSYDNHG